jgi:hypothetical protein
MDARLVSAPLIAALCGASYDVVAADRENLFLYCAPASYKLSPENKEISCTLAEAERKHCDPWRVDLSELTSEGGSYTVTYKTETRDMWQFTVTQKISISRSTGKFRRDLDNELQFLTQVGTCELHKETLKF